LTENEIHRFLTAISEQVRKEINASSFLATLNLARPATTVADLDDGAVQPVLLDVLALVTVSASCRPSTCNYFKKRLNVAIRDAEYFMQSNRFSTQLFDEWVLRFSTPKRLY